MHKLLLAGFALSFALLAACGDEQSNGRSRVKTGGLSAPDYNRLVDINRMQQDNIDARNAAHNLIQPLLNEKSKPMSEKIAYPNCVKSGDIPDNDLTGQVHEETISGPANSCPIYWYRRRGWTLADKTMVMTDNLEIRDANYRNNYSKLSIRSLVGRYRISLTDFGSQITGTINIENFQTTDYGRITGSILVDYTRRNDRANGSIVLTLTGTRWGSQASITWSSLNNGGPRDVVYRVNNIKFDKSQFNDLFSSYELDKYMDNVLNMK